jgi:hypothetical protein
MKSLWIVLVLVSLRSVSVAQSRPTISIATPTSASTYTTSTSPLLVGGTARDNRRVTRVTWMNDRGGSGTATGTTQWSASIPLQGGMNRVTVTAWDQSNNRGTDTLTITLQAPPPPPGPITVEWSWPGGGDAFQMERCVAPQPCSMASVAAVAIGDRSWVDTAVSPTLNYCYRLAVLTGGLLGPYSNILCSP